MLTLWTDRDPIQRGQYYDIQMQANVSNTIKIQGAEVVNYHGPLGYGLLHLLARRTLSERRSIPDRCRQFSKFDDNDRVDAAITTCRRLSRRGSEAIKSHLKGRH